MAGTEYSLSIPSGSLITALDQFSKQTGLQIAAELKTPELQQHAVDAVVGSFSAEAALAKLLVDSNLVYVWEDESTIRIYEGVVPPRGVGNVNEVLVTGSRIEGGHLPAPVRIYDRADIARHGVSSLPALAAYFTQQPFSFGEWAQRSGAQHFQMRGLGVDTTLVLINGRRAPPSATSVTLNAFDLNTIPITAVDRIEVMSDSASAIYGADAIGGVVNIILRDRIEAPEVYVHYGAAAGGADERRFAFSIGAEGERLKSSLVLDYFERGVLLGAERDLWRDQDFRRFGGKDYRVSTASPANVYSLSGGPLPGLTSAQASVPVGSTGVGLRPEDFLETAGVMSLASAEATQSIFPDLHRRSAFGSAEFVVNDALTVFGETLVAANDVVAQGAMPSISRQVVPAENPYNPFGVPVLVDYSMMGMKPISVSTESELMRFVLGARGGTSSWRWELVVARTDEDVDSVRLNDLNPARVRAALASTEPESALNPFADGPAGSPALLNSLVGDSQVFDYFSGGQQVSGFLRGRLFEMPGGASEFVMGSEWRREQLKFSDTMALDRERDIASGFSEIKLPLLKALSIKLALRKDFYEEADDSINPQYGVVWSPTKDLVLRAAYGTSFRPPSLVEVFSPRTEYIIPVVDTRRGSSIYPVRVAFGGNSDLGNVSAHSFTSGITYSPTELPGFSIGAHYWRVVMNDRVVVPRFSDLANIEDIFPQRVRRSPETAGDPAGWRGAIEWADLSLLNYGRLETSGIDLDLSGRISRKTGNLQAELSATWVDEYASQDLNAVLPRDRVGIANLQGTIPEWRLEGTLTWEANSWGASAITTFTPSYRDADLTGVLSRRLPSRTTVDVQGWLDFGHLLEPDFFSGLRLTAGVLNVLDNDVDFANAGLMIGFDISQSDLRQRFAYLRINKVF